MTMKTGTSKTPRAARRVLASRLGLAGLAVGVVLAATGIAGGQPAPRPSPQAAQAQSPYAGVWYDDSGKGAVEIAGCDEQLCGKIVWLKQPTDRSGQPLTDGNNPDPRRRAQPICGLPVIGDLKRQRDGSWDNGWIYDPKEGKSYDVALTLRNSNVLQVTGYLGMKFLGETFAWKRAPADLPRCQQTAAR